MWEELRQKAEEVALRVSAGLPGKPVPIVVSIDPPEINEATGSVWHVKARFNMRCG